MPLRQRAGLVRAQHVDRAQILDGRETLDDDAEARQPQRSARKRHRHDHGKKLGRQPYCQRHREQE